MPTVFDAMAREALIARLAKLASATPRRWGRMSAQQMVWHLDAQLRCATGELAVKPRGKPFMRTALFRWLFIDSPLPWPRGKLPAAPEYLAPDVDPAAFTEVVAALRSGLEAYAARGRANGGIEHPAFGRLEGPQAGRLLWRHWNHHLTQFGA